MDDNGDPLAFGTVETFAAGLSVHAATYSNSTGTPNANPVQLNAAGRCVIYLDALSYSFIVRDQFGVTISSTDPIQSAGLAGSGGDAFESFEFGGDSASPVTVTTYPTGALVSATHAGTALMVIDPSNIPAGTYVLRAMILEAGGGTVSVAIVDLLAGSPDTPLAVASGTSTTGAQVESAAITFPAGGVAHSFAIKTKTSAGAAFIWGIQLATT
jgi:hypothetical protein